MSHFEFIIPLQRDELLHSGAGEYKVQEVLPVAKLDKEIQNCINVFHDEGCMYILDCFDTLYSVLVHFSKVEWPLIHKIFDKLIIGSLNQLIYYIQPQVEDIPDSDARTRSLNILKMNLYIFTQCHSCCHDRLSFECSTIVPDKGKGKKQKKSSMDESSWDWDERQRQALIALYQLLQLHISKLWDPPVTDEQFINMCANCCYKALEHPTIAHVKSKPLRETLFQVLGFLIKRYSHGISCVVKIVQMLTLFEHLVSPLANGVVMFVRDMGFKSLVNEIVRELMTSTDSSNDSTSVRSFSNFLVEIAELQPEIMIPTTKELTKYLEQDPYSMRCCVLSVMAEILLSQLSQDDLDENGKEQRDLYLDLLLEHSTDTNAFVRSRVLQLWQKIVQNHAIPKAKFLVIVDMALERILDKSSNVCKNAITLLKDILQQNPYGVTLDLKLLSNQLLQAEEQLQSLERSAGSFKNMTRENIWQVLQPEIIVFLSTIIKFDDFDIADSQLTQLLTKDTIQENIKTIAILITNRKYEQAYNLVRTVEQAFPISHSIKASMPANNTLEYYLTIMKEMFMMYSPSEEEVPPICPADNNTSGDKTGNGVNQVIIVQQRLVVYLMDCLEFTKKMEEAIEYVIAILNEESIPEVLEAINFLAAAYQFGAPYSEKGVQEMLTVVHRREPAIKEAVNAAYKDLYLVVREKSSKKEKAVEEVNRLSKLASSLDFGQLDALTQLIVGWIKNKELDQEFIQVLWERVKLPSDKISEKQSALVLLSMVTLERPMAVKDELEILIKEGLSVDCSNARDMYSVVFTCKAIYNIVVCMKQKRYPPGHELFTLLMDIVKNSFTKVPGNDDFTIMAQQVIDIVMELCTVPEKLCEELLCDLFDLMKYELSEPVLNATCSIVDENPDETGVQCAKSNETKLGEDVIENFEEKQITTDSFLRFLFLIGRISFKYGEYLETCYLETLKAKKRSEFKLLSPSTDVSKIMSSSRHSAKFKAKSEDEVISESDLLAAADDTAIEEVRLMLDQHIVNGDGIIAGFCQLVINVCKSHKRYCASNLKCVAVISLTQLMMVSSEFCSKHMQLLVTMLEKSPEEAVRSSLVVAFGDLLFKFPNTVEPWTRFLYARLRDESWKVRLSTLLVLSHLVTNEMVKVKGQISEVALCIVDENEVLQNLAKKFFSELSLKGNTLYNVLPDIISHLSNPESDIVIEENTFEIILKYIMEQIQKEKQLENLVEKLCKRMKESICERQWKDLAFCLSLLPWSDRSLRKLLDHANCFCDRLLYQPVATLFLSIVSSVTKSTKPGLKEIGEELSAILNDVLTKGSTDRLKGLDETNDELPSKTPARNPRKTPAKTPGTRKTTKKVRKKKYLSDSEEEPLGECSDEDVQKEEVQFKKTTRTRNAAVKLF